MTPLSPRLLLGSAVAALATTLLLGCGKTPEATPVTPAPSTTIGTQVDDAVITTGVKAALLADAEIKSLDISVATVKGEVQLNGFVNNQAQMDQALQIARTANGATGVKNELKVRP